MNTVEKIKKVLVILPAYNASRTLKKIYQDIPKKIVTDVLLVDDASYDNTIDVAKSIGIKNIIAHPKNLGYGANQKTCYTYALKTEADYIIMLHPDGQYNPKDIEKFIHALDKGNDIVLGSRFAQGMYHETPFYKSIALKIITSMYHFVLGLHLTEVNTGYRAYTKEVLMKIPFMKNGSGYIFDPQFIIQAKYFKFKIAEVPVTKLYNKEAISPNLAQSIKHGIENMLLLIEYVLHKYKIRKAPFLINKNS